MGEQHFAKRVSAGQGSHIRHIAKVFREDIAADTRGEPGPIPAGSDPLLTSLSRGDVMLAGLGRRTAQDTKSNLEELIRRARPPTVFVSLIDPYERTTDGRLLVNEVAAVGLRRHDFYSFPVVDGDIPRSLIATTTLVTSFSEASDRPRPVMFTCFAGCGRSGMMAACTLVSQGMRAIDALVLVDRERRRTLREVLRSDDPIVEGSNQRSFVDRFARFCTVLGGAHDWQEAFLEPVSGFIDRPDDEEVLQSIKQLRCNENLEAFAVAVVTFAAFDRKSRCRAELIELAGKLKALMPRLEVGCLAGDMTPQARKGIDPNLARQGESLGQELLRAYSLDSSQSYVAISAVSSSEPALAHSDKRAGVVGEVAVAPGMAGGRPEEVTEVAISVEHPQGSGAPGASMSPTADELDVDFERDIARENYAVQYLVRHLYYGEDLFKRLFPALLHPDQIGLGDPETAATFDGRRVLRSRVRSEDFSQAMSLIRKWKYSAGRK